MSTGRREREDLTIRPIINELEEQSGWELGIQEGQWTTSLNLASCMAVSFDPHTAIARFIRCVCYVTRDWRYIIFVRVKNRYCREHI